ncbi:hypothetical protein Taro_015340 [Colocasia esculenta]|uniref:DUF4378 domain-containing protein n=1 Tax=Colocasia esculenta TaxID=4460 RepID=A0A843UKK3_COLES|nr:hypothetical protein [Colocasia esculenta]
MLDVDRLQHSGRGGRSRRRERPPRPAFGEWEDGVPELRAHGGGDGELLASTDGARGGEGNRQNKQRVNTLVSASDCSSKNPMQLNTLAFELAQGSSKKVSGTSIKMLIDQEITRGMQPRRRSPGVVAKLMGLDSLPTQQTQFMRKESVSCLHKGSSEGFLRKQLSYDFEDPQNYFEDVFEVMETKMTEEPGNWPVQKSSSKTRQKQRKIDYIRQKFMDVKRLSTDEKLQNSKQFSEALEVLESNKDLFLKLLQEPSSLFIKHLEEYQSSSTTPEASHIMILKSYITEYEINDLHWISERKAEKRTHFKRNIVDKYENDFVSHCIKEHNISLAKKLLKNKLERKTDSTSHPTNIVVLKPSLENVQEKACHENLQFGYCDYRRHREVRRSVTRERFPEFQEQQKFADDVVVTQRSKGSREIAKKISRHMINTVPHGSVETYGLEHNVYPRYRHSHRTPGASTFMDSGTRRRSSNWLEKSHSLAYSTETSVIREARNRLSERWKMIHKSREIGPADQDTSTLGEMLALSDNEMPEMPSSLLPYQKSSRNKISGKEELLRWGSPSGISSRDSWKDECSSSFLRSKSVPASPFVSGAIHSTSDNDNSSMLNNGMNLSSRKSSERCLLNERLISSYKNVKICSNSPQHSDHVVDENTHHMCETSVDQDERQNDRYTKKFSKEKTTISETKNRHDSKPVVCGDGAEVPLPTEQLLLHSAVSAASVDAEGSIICDQKENVAKEPSSNEPITESFPTTTGQACSPIVEVAEHPSPVSVLEPPDENEASPECFERVNADLQAELCVQLQILKSESRETDDKGSVVLSGVDTDVGGEGALQARGNQPTFGDEDNMEFCYLIEVLTGSGFYDADWDMLFSVCFSPESPIAPDVFEKLEAMYHQSAWPRTERKLFFDLINSALAEILAPSMTPRPRIIKPRRIRPIGLHRHLADEVWQTLVRARKEATNDAVGTGMEDLRWLDLGDDIDAVGRWIEKVLYNDLLEELICETRLLDKSVYTCRHCRKNNSLSAKNGNRM